jgi:SNF2 family DNA or RNA helicase
LKLFIEKDISHSDYILYKSEIKAQIDDVFFSEIFLLNEDYLLINSFLYKIQPVGQNYSKLDLLNSSFLDMELEKFLSLFFSHFNNIKLVFENYKVKYLNPKNVIPCLIISTIDDRNFLHLKLSGSLMKFTPDFFEDNNLKKIAQINDLESTIEVSDLLFSDYNFIYEDVQKMLNRYGRNVKKKIKWFYEGNTFVISPEVSEEFLRKEIFELMGKYLVFGVENLKKHKIITTTPKLKLDITSGIDFLEGTAEIEIEDKIFSIYEFINMYKNNSYIMLNKDTTAVIERKYVDKIKRIFKGINKNDTNVKISFFDLPIVEELIENKLENETVLKNREIFTGFNKINKLSIPKNIVEKTELRSYQKYGFKWLSYLNEINLNGCLADDMGLGKTIQAISLLNTIYVLNKPKKILPSLIILPKTLLVNWQNELKRFAPKLDFAEYYGTDRDFKKAYKHKIILTTYALVRNDIKIFMEKDFLYVILDESQNIKNIMSKISRAVMLLKCEHRLALSGTPIENNLYELYSLFRFLNPTMFGSKDEFSKHYIDPIHNYNDDESRKELRKKIAPFILRRLKKDVAKDLPEKNEQILYVDMDKEHALFYEARRRYYFDAVKQKLNMDGLQKSRFFILQALTELRQIAAMPEIKTDNTIISPKRKIILDSISDIIGNNHKCLVFTNYLGVIEVLSDDFNQFDCDYLVMTGATRNRQELVDKFQNDDNTKIFMMTLKTGGIGLNLTAAEYVFIFDPWWNIAAETQAVDRTHRIGQSNNIFCYKIITKNTIEEKIILLQEKKKNLFDSIISDDSSISKKLTEEDIDYILK